MPVLRPTRPGGLLSTTAAMLAGTNAPSNMPMTARITSRLPNPMAKPVAPHSIENTSTDVIKIPRRPRRSDSLPNTMDEMPQVRATAAEIRPIS